MRAYRLLTYFFPLLVACTPASPPSDPTGDTAADTLSADAKVYCIWQAGDTMITLVQTPDQLGTNRCTYDYVEPAGRALAASDNCFCSLGYTLPSDALLCAASVDTDVGVTTTNYQLSDGTCVDQLTSTDGSSLFHLFVPCTDSNTCGPPASP